MNEVDKVIARLGAYIAALEHNLAKTNERLVDVSKELDEALVKIAKMEAVAKHEGKK